MNDYKELIALAENCMDIRMECRNCNCPYEGVSVVNDFCMNHLADDLVKAIEQLVRERDAAVADIPERCATCKHTESKKTDSPCDRCFKYGTGKRSQWEWRGVKDES